MAEPSYNPDSVYPKLTNDQVLPKKVTVMDDFHEINDIRTVQDFQGISFSNYKKSDVKKQLIDSLSNGKLETSCYWSSELICAGHFSELWEIILYYTSKHIHLGNPRIAIYLHMRYKVFRNIMNKGTLLHDIDARNDEECRKLFAEIMITLAQSSKKMGFEEVKVKKQEDFDMTYMKERLKAQSMEYVKPIFQKKDPKEIFIALNEFAYFVSSDGNNINSACYWYEWAIEFDASCKKRKLQCICEPRNVPVENKFRCDIVWIFWDVLFHYCNQLNDDFIEKIMTALFHLFCIRYTNACCKRRRYLIYYAISLLTESVPKNTEIVQNKALLKTGLSKINLIYKQIKQNEETPSTDYLFHNIDKQKVVERSIQQMEIINNMNIFQS